MQKYAVMAECEIYGTVLFDTYANKSDAEKAVQELKTKHINSYIIIDGGNKQ